MATSDKIVVTGGTGMVGSHLAAGLLARGYSNVVLPVRSPANADNLRKTLHREGVSNYSNYISVVECPLDDPVELGRILHGAAVVFHCAAAVSLGGMDSRRLIDENVAITSTVLDTALEQRVRRFVHVSSIAALGDASQQSSPANENSFPESPSGLSDYAAGKILCENEVRRAVQLGLDAVIVNPSVILGLGNGTSGSSAIVRLLSRGIPFYTGGVTGYADVRDVARAMILLSGSEFRPGERFIISSGNYSYKRLLRAGAAASGHTAPIIKVGKKTLGMVARLATLFCGNKSLFNRQIASSLTSKHYYDGTKIEKMYNFEYTPLEQTVKRIVKQFLEENGR